MFTHYKEIQSRLSPESKKVMEDYYLSLDESHTRHYGRIGSLMKNGKMSVLIYNDVFYIYDSDLPVNKRILSLIREVEKIDEEIPMQEIK